MQQMWVEPVFLIRAGVKTGSIFCQDQELAGGRLVRYIVERERFPDSGVDKEMFDRIIKEDETSWKS